MRGIFRPRNAAWPADLLRELSLLHLLREGWTRLDSLPEGTRADLRKTKETARAVVQKVVDELRRKLEQPTRQAVLGSLNKSSRTRRPRYSH